MSKQAASRPTTTIIAGGKGYVPTAFGKRDPDPKPGDKHPMNTQASSARSNDTDKKEASEHSEAVKSGEQVTPEVKDEGVSTNKTGGAKAKKKKAQNRDASAGKAKAKAVDAKAKAEKKDEAVSAAVVPAKDEASITSADVAIKAKKDEIAKAEGATQKSFDEVLEDADDQKQWEIKPTDFMNDNLQSRVDAELMAGAHESRNKWLFISIVVALLVVYAAFVYFVDKGGVEIQEATPSSPVFVKDSFSTPEEEGRVITTNDVESSSEVEAGDVASPQTPAYRKGGIVVKREDVVPPAESEAVVAPSPKGERDEVDEGILKQILSQH